MGVLLVVQIQEHMFNARNGRPEQLLQLSIYPAITVTAELKFQVSNSMPCLPRRSPKRHQILSFPRVCKTHSFYKFLKLMSFRTYLIDPDCSFLMVSSQSFPLTFRDKVLFITRRKACSFRGVCGGATRTSLAAQQGQDISEMRLQ